MSGTIVSTRIVSCVLLMITINLIQVIPAYADGGTVQFQQRAGAYVITVFSASNPVRVGSEDISVMIQNRDDPHPLLDAEVFLSIGRSSSQGVPTNATREQAQNKLLYATVIHFPEPGHWEVKVDVQREMESFSVTGVIEVAPSRSSLLSYWPLLAFPPFAVLLFICNQILKHQLRSRNQTRHRTSNKTELG